MSSSTCSFWGFIFVFVSVISPKCVDGWVWVADDLSLGLGSRSGDKGDEGSGGGGGKLKCWNELNEGSGRGGNCGGRMKLLNDGEDGGRRGNPPLLLLLSFLLNPIFSFRNTSSLFRILKSTPGVGFFLITSLTISFFPTSSSRRKDGTIGFCPSNVETSSNTSSREFWCRKIFFDIGSSFYLKVALFNLFHVT